MDLARWPLLGRLSARRRPLVGAVALLAAAFATTIGNATDREARSEIQDLAVGITIAAGQQPGRRSIR